MLLLAVLGGFVAVMYALNRLLRAWERDGSFDPQAASSAARPGMRWFFDFDDDGVRQRPPDR